MWKEILYTFLKSAAETFNFSVIISIIGFGITLYSISKGFKNSLIEKLTEDRRVLYIKVFRLVNKIYLDRIIIYNNEIFQEYADYQAEMSILSSEKLNKLYNDLGVLMQKYRKSADDFYEKNNIYKFDSVEIAGVWQDDPLFNDQDEKIFAWKLQKNKEDNLPSDEEIIKLKNEILKQIQRDIGNK